MARYFAAYARKFRLYPHIQFSTSVERVEPHENAWRVALSSGETREYSRVVVANGHDWDPQWPTLEGETTAEISHSHDYRTADRFEPQPVRDTPRGVNVKKRVRES